MAHRSTLADSPGLLDIFDCRQHDALLSDGRLQRELSGHVVHPYQQRRQRFRPNQLRSVREFTITAANSQMLTFTMFGEPPKVRTHA